RVTNFSLLICPYIKTQILMTPATVRECVRTRVEQIFELNNDCHDGQTCEFLVFGISSHLTQKVLLKKYEFINDYSL
ncbi:MAG: hypothetical protein O7D30_08140, partial [Rickettsia endosymbiont of Ixodes persulcatus]|nr:hypothetical protein [Rickettsia endosymbiont of Ixodes persulcatus]